MWRYFLSMGKSVISSVVGGLPEGGVGSILRIHGNPLPENTHKLNTWHIPSAILEYVESSNFVCISYVDS